MSVVVRFQGASFAFEGRALFLEHLDFQLDRGWTGVVGENGAGKTTLLRLITGELKPSEGQVRVVPEGVVVLCEQQADALPPSMVRFGEDPGPEGWEWLGRLELEPSMLERWPALSPGERKRFQLAEALASEPDVLLVDEPTNHLDSDGRARVLSALERFDGVGLVVSHDRDVLTRLTHRTLRLAGKTARLWPVSYEGAREAWLAEEAHEHQLREAKKTNVVKLQRQLAERRREQEGASHQRSARVRMKSRYDSDARTLGADFRASSAEKRLGRNVQVVRREHARAQKALAEHTVVRNLGSALLLESELAPRPLLLHLERDNCTLPSRSLWRDLTLTLGRTERIWLSGANGAGKSTLMRRLYERSTLSPERVLYLPQELSAEEGREVLCEVQGLSDENKGRLLTRVAALGLEPERLLTSAQLSPGELRKLLLARALEQRVWLLLLDEPTNHLDLPSVERLEETLREFSGAVLLITHDTRFARTFTTQRWHLENETVDVSTTG
jgi:ATPase subunit of ABC transporter with duplicated ATPase domains